MRIADLHNRFGAFVIDWHLRTIPVAIWGFIVFAEWYPRWLQSGAARTSITASRALLEPILARPDIALGSWLCLAAYLLYHPVIEIALHGDSPGKRMMGIRVVSLDGSRPATRQVLVRNLWRAIEFLPFAYLWGMYAIWRSPENARTGDIRAGTRVVMST